ncbi:MAG: hypothetical protein JSR82_14400 [Verrucomicrobia bacterium]|nr:hypothetical protein [Verrucomicrobiota bacterium]
MGLCLCIFSEDGEDLAEYEVGHYSDFGYFRDTIAKHLQAAHYPLLMDHSDCDGEWNVGHLPRMIVQRGQLRTSLTNPAPEVHRGRPGQNWDSPLWLDCQELRRMARCRTFGFPQQGVLRACSSTPVAYSSAPAAAYSLFMSDSLSFIASGVPIPGKSELPCFVLVLMVPSLVALAASQFSRRPGRVAFGCGLIGVFPGILAVVLALTVDDWRFTLFYIFIVAVSWTALVRSYRTIDKGRNGA